MSTTETTTRRKLSVATVRAFGKDTAAIADRIAKAEDKLAVGNAEQTTKLLTAGAEALEAKAREIREALEKYEVR